jgi:hypothetical protein
LISDNLQLSDDGGETSPNGGPLPGKITPVMKQLSVNTARRSLTFNEVNSTEVWSRVEVILKCLTEIDEARLQKHGTSISALNGDF